MVTHGPSRGEQRSALPLTRETEPVEGGLAVYQGGTVGIALRAAGLLHFVRAVKMTSLNREPRSACPNKADKRSHTEKAFDTWP